MKKRLFAIAMAAVLSLSMMSACNSSGGDDKDISAVTGDALKEKELATLDVVMMGNDKKDKDKVLAKVNEILEEELNINMNLTLISYGNYV